MGHHCTPTRIGKTKTASNVVKDVEK
jgi:hypothetical protein